MSTQVTQHIEQGVMTISFREEEERKRCTLDWDNIAQLDAIIDTIDESTVRAVVIASESPKSFLVGADIGVLQTLDGENIQRWVRNGHAVFSRLQKIRIPVIAKVESYALGGGLELALWCDFIIATEEAVFAQPEAGLGVMPGWGASYRLANLIGPNRAKEMLFTGRRITAVQAYEWGLVNHVCSKESIAGFLDDLIADITRNDANVIGFVKEIITNHMEVDSRISAFNESVTSSVCMNSDSTKRRLSDFFATRKKR